MLWRPRFASANAILRWRQASASSASGSWPPGPSLFPANIIRDGQTLPFQQAWWISTLPGMRHPLIAFSLHFLSDGIREEHGPPVQMTLATCPCYRKDPDDDLPIRCPAATL